MADIDSDQIMIGELAVNRIGLGTNKITDTPEARALLQYAVQSGVNFIDTAYLYTGGASETTIGNSLAPYPEGLVVASKGGYDNGPEYNSEAYLRSNLEESLRRLQTDRIALYHLHRVDPKVPLKQTMELFKTFQAEGKIRYIGLSEVDTSQIEEARQYADIVSVQNEYSITERKHDTVVDYCGENNIVFIPWFPLRNINGEQMGVIQSVADNHQAAIEQIALAWLLRRSPVMLPIPGTLSKQHLSENIAAKDIRLSDDEFNRLSAMEEKRDEV